MAVHQCADGGLFLLLGIGFLSDTGIDPLTSFLKLIILKIKNIQLENFGPGRPLGNFPYLCKFIAMNTVK